MQSNHLACLASDDNGLTWYDYAVSKAPYGSTTWPPYAVGGARELTADGCIVGSFTASVVDPATDNKVYFFKIQAGLSKAEVVSFSYAAGNATLCLTNARGQPAEVRLGSADGSFTAWAPFAESNTLAMALPPNQFQLKSRLGVESEIFPLGAYNTTPTGGTGPGGIGTTDGASSLELWLDAGALSQAEGSGVSSWPDRSGIFRTQVQATPANQPQYRANVINGRPVVRSPDDGTDRYFSGGFATLDSADGGFTAFAVVQATNKPGRYQGILCTTADYTFDLYVAADWTPVRYRFYPSGINYESVGDWDILSFYTRTNGTPRQAFYEDGTLCVTGTTVSAMAASSSFNVFRVNTTTSVLIGDAAELIAHGRALNAAERTIIENYLSAKYALTQNTGGGALDVYAGDNPAKGDYDTDVFGIGNLGGEKVTSSGAAGFGLSATNGTLDTGEWVMAGHNGAPATNVQDTTGFHWGQDWYVDVTGSVDVNMTFDISDAGASALPYTFYKLRYRATFADSWTSLALTATVMGDRISFSVPAAQLADGYYTLGADEPETPGPATITADPQSRTNNPGTSASFTVSASGTMPLYYQWQSNSVNIALATNATYTIVSVTAGDAGNYRCIVSNVLNAATSAVAVLTVTAPATVITGGTGPGGIGTTDGASSLELWMDAGVLSQADGSAVSSWPDRSGNGRT
ncbi:MAG: immunoglobulin domain-containing protein, partial [Acidobacteria bacterium]|nr:immunoglobulin domain-containing protein [Acidobacteriota bacterium]